MYRFLYQMFVPPESIHDGKDTEQGQPRSGTLGYVHGWSDHSGGEKNATYGANSMDLHLPRLTLLLPSPNVQPDNHRDQF